MINFSQAPDCYQYVEVDWARTYVALALSREFTGSPRPVYP